MAADQHSGLVATAAAAGPPLLWQLQDLELLGLPDCWHSQPGGPPQDCTALAWLWCAA